MRELPTGDENPQQTCKTCPDEMAVGINSKGSGGNEAILAVEVDAN